MKHTLSTLFGLLVFTSAGLAESAPDYGKEVQPLFDAHCVRCHGKEKKRADLDLTSLAALSKGGESGPVVVAGDVEKSLLFERVHAGTMPPGKNPKLTADQQGVLKRWIEAGTLGTSSAVVVDQHTIEPMMALRCTVCHGLRKQEGGLDLRTKASMLKGGKSGPAIVLGKPGESLLLKKIHSGAMPPRDQLIRSGVKPIGEGEVETLAEWIRAGAPEVNVAPDVATTKPDPLVTDKDRRHWAFRPVGAVAVPPMGDSGENAVDAFVGRKQREQGLAFAPVADRVTLIRRVTFDLTGLPPTPEEVRAFLEDESPRAYEKVVDRLLASPRYGERWGRFWLDLAGYADSEGKRSADPIRPHAWRYRDYVIRSFNDDKPYDRFLTEQIAGDELVDYENASKITKDISDALVATGFLRMAPDGTGSDIVNSVPERLEVIADELQVLGSSVLGLTLQCARCHSHKYDPIPHRDYYRLVAVFKGAYDEHDWLKPTAVKQQSKSKVGQRALAFLADDELTQWKEHEERLRQRIEELKKRPKADGVSRQIRALENSLGTPPKIRALWDRGTPSSTYIYRRGDYLQPSRLVGPGVPSVLTDGKTPFVVEKPFPGAKSTGRRLAFAKWLVSPEHPLTARVMVNRIWKQHFGAGIVETVSNFGVAGAKPTHPELLDWLARKFVESGWSIKAMHRLMVTSRTYRQSSHISAKHTDADPKNRWLARMPMRRIDAEEVRDSLLRISGELDETPFGPPDLVHARKDGLVTAIRGERGWRRSVYVMHRRSQIPTILENFDLPQMNPNCTERVQATVSTQALHLLNNAHIETLAEALAKRVIDEVGDDAKARVERLGWLVLSRPLSSEERSLGLEAVRVLASHWREHLADEDKARTKALATYAHTLMNSAAFLYVD